MVIALPGAMPVMNRAAVEMSMLVGLALVGSLLEGIGITLVFPLLAST